MLVDSDRRGPLRLAHDARARLRVCADVDRVDSESLGEESGHRLLRVHADRVAGDDTGGEGDAAGDDPAAVLVGVVERQRGRLGLVVGQSLGTGECGGVCGRLQLAVGAVPGADVQDGGGEPEENAHEEHHQDDRLAALVREEASFHTLRRRAREPADLTTSAEQVDRVGVGRRDGDVRTPASQGEVTETSEIRKLEIRGRVVRPTAGRPPARLTVRWRPTAPLRAPARTASVSVM